jgi:O-antigen ligase
MTAEVQATSQLGARPITGVLVPTLLAGIGTIAAIGLWLFPLWVGGAMGVAVLTFLLFRFPRLYVYLFLVVALLPLSFLNYLDQFRLFGGGEAGANIVGLGWSLSIVLFVVYSLWKKKRWWRIPYYRPFFVLIGLALPAVMLSHSWLFGVRAWVHLTAPICLSLLLFSTITNRKQAIQVMGHIFSIFGFVLAIGVYQLLIGTGSYDFGADVYRLTGIYGGGGEVSYAVLLLYLICLAAPVAITEGRKRNTYALPTLLCSILLLLSSASRAPLLAFLAAAPLMLWKLKVKRKYWLLLIAIAGVGQLSPRVYARFGVSLLYVPTRFLQQDVSTNMTQRIATWAMLSDQFLNAKTAIMGRGFGSTDYYLLNELDDPTDFFAHGPHNEYLRLLLDLGLTGVLLFVGQLVLLYRTGSKLATEPSDHFSQGLGVSLCAIAMSFALVAFTSSMYGVGAQNVVFWIFAGLLLATAKWAPMAQPGLVSTQAVLPFCRRVDRS